VTIKFIEEEKARKQKTGREVKEKWVEEDEALDQMAEEEAAIERKITEKRTANRKEEEEAGRSPADFRISQLRFAKSRPRLRFLTG
jgi:hypothetical protein